MITNNMNKQIKIILISSICLFIIGASLAGFGIGVLISNGTNSKSYEESTSSSVMEKPRAEDAEYVYITENGKKFHEYNCMSIANSKTKKVTLDQALKQRKEACAMCYSDAKEFNEQFGK